MVFSTKPQKSQTFCRGVNSKQGIEAERQGSPLEARGRSGTGSSWVRSGTLAKEPCSCPRMCAGIIDRLAMEISSQKLPVAESDAARNNP